MRIALACLLALAAMAAPARGALWVGLPAPKVGPPPAGSGALATVKRAQLAGAVTAGDARHWRADVRRARAALRRLSGVRRAELASVLGALDGLTVSRMPLAFLTVERNATFWRTRPFPRPGQRMTFGRDPAVFQYFPGQGIQFHPLATAGKANALAGACQRAAAANRARALRVRLRIGPPAAARWGGCRHSRFRATLDRLVDLSSRRAGFTAWEYRFDFGGGTAPWISAMTQGTAAQALARGYDTFADERYRATALAALGAYETPSPAGVASGNEYLMYSFSPGLHILNGFLQAVIGLHDVAELTGSPRARRLYALGERSARGMLGDYDTGAWSRYSLAGREATLEYHELVTDFLDGLCTRTQGAPYCRAAKRFEFYLHEPPAIRVTAPRRATQNHGTGFSVWVSKVSELSVTVTDAFHTTTTLPRGSLPFSFTPRRHGTYRIRVAATGPEGLTAVRRATLRVRIDPAIVKARRERRAAARRRAAHRRAVRHRRSRFRPR